MNEDLENVIEITEPDDLSSIKYKTSTLTIGSTGDAITHVAKHIASKIDTALEAVVSGATVKSISHSYNSISFIHNLVALSPEDYVKGKDSNGLEIDLTIDPSSMIEVSVLVNSYVPSDITLWTRNELQSTFLQNIPNADLEDLITKATSKVVSAYKKVAKYYALDLAATYETLHNIIVEHGIHGDVFRIFGYFKKNSAGGLGEPIWVNEEAFARFHKDKSVTRINRAVTTSDKLTEVTVAMKDSAIFSTNMSGVHDSLIESCKKLELVTAACKQLTSSTGSTIFLRSATPIDDFEPEEYEDQED